MMFTIYKPFPYPVLQSGGAKFPTVDTNLLFFVDFDEIGGLVFIASLSYIWAGYHAKTSVEATRQGIQE